MYQKFHRGTHSHHSAVDTRGIRCTYTLRSADLPSLIHAVIALILQLDAIVLAVVCGVQLS